MIAAPTAPVRPPIWTALLAFSLAFVASSLVQLGLLALFAAPHLRELKPFAHDPDRLIERLMAILMAGPGFAVAIGGTELMLVGVALVAARLSGRLPVRLGPSRFGVLRYAVTLVGVLAIGQALDGLSRHIPVRSFSLSALGDASHGPAAAFFPLLVVGSLGAGFAEELFFRGYLGAVLAAWWPRWAWIGATALCFGIMHADPVHSPMAAVLGLFLGWASACAESIRPTIVAHAVNNALSFLGSRYGSPLDAGIDRPLAIAGYAALAVICAWALRPRANLDAAIAT